MKTITGNYQYTENKTYPGRIYKMNDIKDAIEITTCTLMGFSKGKYPISRGNCFSLKTEDSKEYRIVNFYHENIQEAIKRGITWPIKIKILSEGIAVIFDNRIPGTWYNYRYCETCCPESLLPEPQKLQIDLQISRGQRERKNGYTLIHFDKTPKLEGKKPRFKLVRKSKPWIIIENKDIRCVFGTDTQQELVSFMEESYNGDTK